MELTHQRSICQRSVTTITAWIQCLNPNLLRLRAQVRLLFSPELRELIDIGCLAFAHMETAEKFCTSGQVVMVETVAHRCSLHRLVVPVCQRMRGPMF